MSREEYYIGTELKYAIALSCPGFSQATDDYTITLRCNNKEVVIPKEEVIDGGNNDYYIVIDTSVFRKGQLKMIVTAEVEDEDLPDGHRTEIAVKNLCWLKNPKA